MIIDTRVIPENESLVIEGEIVEDIWMLPNSDAVKVAGPLSFKTEVSIVTGNLLVKGDFSIPFEFHCSRCLQPFKYTIKLVEHSLISSIESDSVINLTDTIREDILLALPHFPRCEEGDITSKCSATGKFKTEDEFEAPENKEHTANHLRNWEALDKLNFD